MREGFSTKALWGEDGKALGANKKPEGLPPGALSQGSSADPYPAPTSSGLLEYATEYPPNGPDDYAALPETANVYPAPQPESATESAALDGSPGQAISSLMKPGAREG